MELIIAAVVIYILAQLGCFAGGLFWLTRSSVKEDNQK